MAQGPLSSISWRVRAETERYHLLSQFMHLLCCCIWRALRGIKDVRGSINDANQGEYVRTSHKVRLRIVQQIDTFN